MEEFRLVKAMKHEIHISWIMKERHNFSLCHINCWETATQEEKTERCFEEKEKSIEQLGVLKQGWADILLPCSFLKSFSVRNTGVISSPTGGWMETKNLRVWVLTKVKKDAWNWSQETVIWFILMEVIYIKKYAARLIVKDEEWPWKAKLSTINGPFYFYLMSRWLTS